MTKQPWWARQFTALQAALVDGKVTVAEYVARAKQMKRTLGFDPWARLQQADAEMVRVVSEDEKAPA